MDTYCLYDYKQTDYYHGINREDEYYTTDVNLRKPLHQRKRKYPTSEEFWYSTEPKEFKLSCDDQAEWRKFRRWLRKELAKVAANPDMKSFSEINEPKFGHEIGISFGNYEEKA